MTYCVSDIHGCYDEFLQLLKMIQFTSVDTLYVLGDVVDRGDHETECLLHIINTPNMHCLMGNHEAGLLDFYEKGAIGAPRSVPILDSAETGQWRDILDWMKGLPLWKNVTVNGKTFFLSHAGIDPMVRIRDQTRWDFLWGMPSLLKAPWLPGQICVFGHFTTYSIRNDNNCSIWFDDVNRDKIGIDCGCVFGGALGALRLDDGMMFHVPAQARRNGVCALSLRFDSR